MEDRRNAALFEGVAQYVKREGVSVRIFCLNTHPRWGDEELSRKLQERLEGQGANVEWISAKDNLLGCWQGLATCDAVLSVRLHGAITAYLCGVPFSLVEYHRKCTDLIDDIGQPEALRVRSDCIDSPAVERILERLFLSKWLEKLPVVKEKVSSFDYVVTYSRKIVTQ